MASRCMQNRHKDVRIHAAKLQVFKPCAKFDIHVRSWQEGVFRWVLRGCAGPQFGNCRGCPLSVQADLPKLVLVVEVV